MGERLERYSKRSWPGLPRRARSDAIQNDVAKVRGQNSAGRITRANIGPFVGGSYRQNSAIKIRANPVPSFRSNRRTLCQYTAQLGTPEAIGRKDMLDRNRICSDCQTKKFFPRCCLVNTRRPPRICPCSSQLAVSPHTFEERTRDKPRAITISRAGPRATENRMSVTYSSAVQWNGDR